MTTTATYKSTDKPTQKQSQLIGSLREGVSIVQMVLYKEMRTYLLHKSQDLAKEHLAMLAGSITNEVFGSLNPADKFVQFREKNLAAIEQELLALKEEFTSLCPLLTDALRIQTLCDLQEGIDSSTILVRAKQLNFLLEERDIPLPSTFMTAVRELGGRHNLLIPPTQITSEQDASLIH